MQPLIGYYRTHPAGRSPQNTNITTAIEVLLYYSRCRSQHSLHDDLERRGRFAAVVGHAQETNYRHRRCYQLFLHILHGTRCRHPLCNQRGFIPVLILVPCSHNLEIMLRVMTQGSQGCGGQGWICSSTKVRRRIKPSRGLRLGSRAVRNKFKLSFPGMIAGSTLTFAAALAADLWTTICIASGITPPLRLHLGTTFPSFHVV